MNNNTFISNLIRLCAYEDGTLPARLRFDTSKHEIQCWIYMSDVFAWEITDPYVLQYIDLAELSLSTLDPNDALVVLACQRHNAIPASWYLKIHPQVAEALR